MDEFGTDCAEDCIAGFPEHLHRGFEDVIYMLDGRSCHRGNHGNEGLLVPESVQWMTAGRDLVHSEMPEQMIGPYARLPALGESACGPENGCVEFALERRPALETASCVSVKVIAEDVCDAVGRMLRSPAERLVTDPLSLDVALAPGGWRLDLLAGHKVFPICLRRHDHSG